MLRVLGFPVVSKSSRPLRSHDHRTGERHLPTETDDYLRAYLLQPEFGIFRRPQQCMGNPARYISRI